MILINTDKKELKRLHLKYMKETILDRIREQQNNYWNGSGVAKYDTLLIYIQNNIETILSGEIEELKEIINRIENNYYISSVKLKGIKSKRKKEKASIRNGKLSQFISSNNLINHLPTLNYSKVEEFDRDINFLIESQTLSEVSTGKSFTYEEALNKIFDYKNFCNFEEDRNNAWDAYKYTEFLNLQVCPYCDRQFIQTFIIKEDKSRPVLDHFYSKSLYPYLAISIFNLIPCCYQCNSTFKGNDDLYNNEVIYPFEEEFKDNVEFKIKYLNYNAMAGINADLEVSLYITTADEKLKFKIQNSIKIFKLNEVYLGHSQYVEDLIRKIYINNHSRIRELYLQNNALFNSESEIEDILFMNMNKKENLGKHILSKLTYDIIKNYKR